MLHSPHLEPDAIRDAHAQIPAVFRDSPQYVHEGLTARAGTPVIVKVETANPIRSFKGRGTWIAVSALAGEGRIGPDRPVVCVSAGNFGQGVAFVARALGIPAVVFCSTRANRRQGRPDAGAGRHRPRDGRRLRCRAGRVGGMGSPSAQFELIVDGDDERISTGAGTTALEVTDAVAAGCCPCPARPWSPSATARCSSG